MTSPQDYERLSAYLDSQLPARERAALEARLAREPELRTALDDLRLDFRLLRALPQVKPPRSFVLSEAQAQALARPRPASGLFPSLRLASALAVVALVVVLVGDLGFMALPLAPGALGGRGAAAPVPASVSPEAQAKAAAETPVLEAFAAQALSTEAPLGTPAPSATLGAGLEAGQAAEQRAAAPAATAETSLAAAATLATPETALAAAPPTQAEGGAPEETMVGAGVSDAAIPTATEALLAMAPLPTTTAALESEAPPPAPARESWVPAPVPAVRYVELALAALALGLGLAAYWLRPR